MNICVFGASSNDIDNKYIFAGEELGRKMAEKGHGLVFGGGRTGLMGAVIRGVNEKKGFSIGIAPKFFDKMGVLSKQCSLFIFTETMRERKQLMEQKSDAFIMTPGGIGTYEEFFEIFTLKQLGRHKKPIGILNTGGYYDGMIRMLEDTVSKGFMAGKCMDLICVASDPEELLNKLMVK